MKNNLLPSISLCGARAGYLGRLSPKREDVLLPEMGIGVVVHPIRRVLDVEGCAQRFVLIRVAAGVHGPASESREMARARLQTLCNKQNVFFLRVDHFGTGCLGR